MALYSHSQLSTYKQCPLKYKLCYLDRIKRKTESIEAFLGKMVHETLKEHYDNVKLTKVYELSELLSLYENLWHKNWHDKIFITKKDLTPDHYHALGKKMLEAYYRRNAPFDKDITIGNEMRVVFALGESDKYRFQGIIDRLSLTPDGIYHINDYKTSVHMPDQDSIDNDHQLAIYQIGVQKKWPDIRDVKLVWHYLAFDRELTSVRSEDKLSDLANETVSLIDEVQAAEHFPPQESGLCEWCEYPDLCPNRKHFYTVGALPETEYMKEDGFVLVNKYAELKEKARIIDDEMLRVKESLVEYARREGITLVRGSDHKARVKFEEKLKFPHTDEPSRKELDDMIVEAGKWQDVSQLSLAALTRIVDSGLWDKCLVDEVMKYGRIEETSSVYISKLKDQNK